MHFKSINYQRYLVSLLLLIVVQIANTNQQKLISPTQSRYSRLAQDDNDGFVPIVQPTEMAKTVAITTITNKETVSPVATDTDTNTTNVSSIANVTTATTTTTTATKVNDVTDVEEERSITIRLPDLKNLLVEFLKDIEDDDDDAAAAAESTLVKRSTDEQRAFITDILFNEKIINRVKKFTEKYIFQAAKGSALNNVIPGGGRVFLFKGFKKLMWPIFIGVQVAKTVLLAMFLPSIIGSLGKMVGKGLVSVSGFGQPTETVDDFEFKDNPPPDSEPTTGVGYNYPQQTIQANHANLDQPSSYDTAPSANHNVLSLYDIADPKPQFSIANTYHLPDYAQNSRKETFQSKKDDFKVFHDIPASSMLLTNYDPFYSPLLSRLDSVFHQLNLGSDDETCREKLVCLMYASPAKYMPYSNLVSAQLSRELNELRKPTSDNVEILRFFKYMRAARDGQDGKNCHNIFKKCSSFTDTEQPAMLTTFNDINKLVHARKLH